MKLSRTIIVAILLVGLICFPLRTFAVSNNSFYVDYKQQEIDTLFTELNELAAEERMLSYMDESALSLTKINRATRLEAIDVRQAELEDMLEALGVKNIDPNNSDDIARLEAVVLGGSNTSIAASIPDPPNLETVANCYTLSQYNGMTYVNGEQYNYTYIYVTDNKGYSGSPLTVSQTNDLIGKESTLLWDVLEHQFSFGLSAYLGAIPGGQLVDWGLGSIFNFMNSLNENASITYVGNNNIYNMSMISVTQMMYCYVYLPDSGWCLCGVKAPNISYARAEYLVANIAGRAYSRAKDYPTVTSSTGTAAVTYVANYLNVFYCDIDRIGSFTVNTYDGRNVRFVPGFAEYPYRLM